MHMMSNQQQTLSFPGTPDCTSICKSNYQTINTIVQSYNTNFSRIYTNVYMDSVLFL